MKHGFVQLALLGSLLLVADLIAAPPRFREDRVLAKPRAEVRARQMNAVAAAHAALGARVHRQYERFGGLQVLQLPKGLPVERAIERLQATGLFEYVEPDYTVEALATPNDPRFTDGSLWGLHNTGQNGGTADADIDAPEAWDIRTDAGDVIVAVIDSGIDYTHPDLAANLWTNPCVGCPVNGIVYSNDVYGINAITGSGDPLDDHFHGTHVAGTIGAVGNNGIGVVGAAWRVRLMALKFLGTDGRGETSDAVECINYAIAKGAHILNNSWGGGAYSQALVDAIAAARAAGIIFVAAAGNNGEDNDMSPMYPASYTNDNIVAVAATDRNDRLGSFSNYGYDSVALTAPGVAIWSTMPTYTTASMSSNNYPTAYHTINGTSMATPHVAGTLALLRAQFPGDSYQQLIQRLLGNVDTLPHLADASKTGGRLNAHRALTQPPGPITRFQINPWRQALGGTQRFTGGSPPLSIICSNGSIGAVSNVWDFGDGSPLSAQSHASHVYSNSGIYQVTLTATAANGQSRTASRQVVVDQNYLMLTNVPFAWIDDTGHTALSLSDESWVSHALPFAFSFYGQPQTNIFIGSNGQLAFTTNGLPSWNGYPPDPAAPNNIICVLCRDLNPALSGGSVRVGVVGSAPNRIFVVTWRNVKSSGFEGRHTFQALLYEDTHDIKFQYLDPAASGDPQIAGGNSAVVGLEHPTGYLAQLYRDATVGPLLQPGQALFFTRQPVSLIEGWPTVLTGNSNGSLDPGETVGETLVLRNEMNLHAAGVTSVLSTTATNVTILNGSAAYPDLPPFAAATNLSSFVYRIGRDVPPGTALEFNLITTVASTGRSYTNRFWRRVGRPGSLVTNAFDSADLNVAIPEHPGVLYSTNFVLLGAGHVLDDVNVSVRVHHDYASQVKLTIRSPGGMELVLTDGAWTPANATDYGIGICGQGEVRTVFDSESTNTFENTMWPYATSIRPMYNTLTIFNGQPAAGAWVLKVEDRWSPFTGTLNCWGLRLISHDTNYVADVFRDCESNAVPVAISLTVTGVANVALPITLAGSDADNDPLSFLTNNPPALGALSAFNPANGSLVYTPPPGYIGPDSFTFSVSDGCATSATATVWITIEPNATNFWSGAVSGDWGTAGNWLSGSVPPPGSAVLFPNAVTQVVSSSVDRVVSDLLFNATNAYTLAGGYKITLTSSLNQDGAGPVTLNSSLAWNGPITLGGNGTGEVTLATPLSGTSTITISGANWTLNADNSSSLGANTKWMLNSGRLTLGNVNRLGYNPATVVNDFLTLNGGALRATAALGNLGNRGLTISTNGGTLDANGQTPALTFNAPNTLRGGGKFVLRNGGRVDFTAAQTSFTGTLKLGNGSGSGNGLTGVRLNDSTFTFNGNFEIDDPAANGPTTLANFSAAPNTVTLGGAITFVGQVFRQPHVFLSRYNGGLLHFGPTAVLSGASPGDAAWFGFRAGGDPSITNQMLIAGTIQDGVGRANVAFLDGGGNWTSYKVTGNNAYTGGGNLAVAASFGNQLGTHIQQGTVFFSHPNALGANHPNNPISIFRATGNQRSCWAGLLADAASDMTLSNQQPITVRPLNSAVTVFRLGGIQPFTASFHNPVVVQNASGASPADMSSGFALLLHQAAGGTTILHNAITASGWSASVMKAAVWEKTGAGTVVLRNPASTLKATPVVRAGTLVLEADAPATGDSGALGDPTIADFGLRNEIQLGGYRAPTGLAPVRLAAVGAVGGTYNPTGGANNIGQLTGVANGSTALDNTTLATGDRVLLLLEGNTQNNSVAPANGIYRVVTGGSTLTLDREADPVAPGAWVTVSNLTGKINAGKLFYLANQNLAFTNGGANGTVQLWLEDEPATNLAPRLLARAGVTVGRDVQVQSSPFIASATLGTDSTNGTATFQGNIALRRNLHLIAAAGSTVNVTGVIDDAGGGFALTKVGEGTVNLTAANTFSGGVTVSAGALLVNNASGSATGSGAVLVGAGALLGGNGQINGPVTVLAGGTLAPGNSLGVLTVSNTLTLSSGSTNLFQINAATGESDRVAGLTQVNFDGVLVITNLAGTVTNGQQFALFNAAAATGNFAAIRSADTNVTWSFNPATGLLTATVTPSIPTTPTNLTYNVSGNVLTLSWPLHYTGWELLVQTNSLQTGLSTNWVVVPGSHLTNQVFLPLDSNVPAVFYRLRFAP